MTDETAKMQHVAYFDGGAFHWMSGIAPRDCELYAKWRSPTPEPAQPAESPEVGAEGTFACPICGEEKPHHHTAPVVDAYRTKGSRK